MSNAAKKVSVVITADSHKHEGQPVAKGSTVETDEATARWLIDNKIGQAADAGKKETK